MDCSYNEKPNWFTGCLVSNLTVSTDSLITDKSDYPCVKDPVNFDGYYTNFFYSHYFYSVLLHCKLID